MSDFKAQFDNIKKQISAKEIEKAKLEQQIEDLEKEKQELDSKLKELGIDNITDLEKEIVDLEEQITEGISKCQKILN